MEKKVVKMINIKVTLISDTKTCTNYKAIRHNHKIIYKEPNYNVTIDYNDILKMTRENDDYLINLEFIPNKQTTGICLLKKENVSSCFDILTSEAIKEDNVITIKYKVLTTNQEVSYKLEV